MLKEIKESKQVNEVLGYNLKPSDNLFITQWLDNELNIGDWSKSRSAEIVKSRDKKNYQMLRFGVNNIAAFDQDTGDLIMGQATGNVSQTWVNAVRNIGKKTYNVDKISFGEWVLNSRYESKVVSGNLIEEAVDEVNQFNRFVLNPTNLDFSVYAESKELKGRMIKESTNDDVIKMFLYDNFPKNKRDSWGTKNLKITRVKNGWVLMNYTTPLLYVDNYDDSVFYFNTTKYSTSTSAIQTVIRRYNNEFNLVEVSERELEKYGYAESNFMEENLRTEANDLKFDSIEIAKKAKQKGEISERDLKVLLKRLNNGEITTDDIGDYFWDQEIELEKAQIKKGEVWLINLYKTPAGVERKNHPFGYRETEALDSGVKSIVIKDFYSPRGNYYYPYYDVTTNNGSGFDYVMYNGKINILG